MDFPRRTDLVHPDFALPDIVECRGIFVFRGNDEAAQLVNADDAFAFNLGASLNFAPRMFVHCAKGGFKLPTFDFRAMLLALTNNNFIGDDVRRVKGKMRGEVLAIPRVVPPVKRSLTRGNLLRRKRGTPGFNRLMLLTLDERTRLCCLLLEVILMLCRRAALIRRR